MGYFNRALLVFTFVITAGCGAIDGIGNQLTFLNGKPFESATSVASIGSTCSSGKLNSRMPSSTPFAIYNGDQRVPLHQTDFRSWGGSVVGMLASNRVASDNSIRAQGRIGSNSNLCDSEPFRDVPFVANCTGALIANDLVLTAGHCVPSRSACSSNSFVFNLSYANEAGTPLQSRTEDIYRCVDLEYSVDNTRDIALIRLDRQAKDKAIFAVNLEDELQNEAPLVCIGHSEGMPLTVSPVGNYKGDVQEYLMHSVDTFGGNSGAPVFNGDRIVGVHAKRAMAHYVSRGSCNIRQAGTTPEAAGRTPEGFYGRASDTRVLKEIFRNQVVGIVGEVSKVIRSGSELTIEGWACALARQDAIDIRAVDSNGQILTQDQAGLTLTEDDNKHCQSGRSHDFRVRVPVQERVKLIASHLNYEMELTANLSDAEVIAPEGPNQGPNLCP